MFKLQNTVKLEGEGVLRAGMTGASVYANSNFRSLFTVDYLDGTRNLHYAEHGTEMRLGNVVKEDVESIAMFRDGNYLRCYGVANERGKFKPFSGKKNVARGSWSFETMSVSLPLEFGDINSSLDKKPIWKGNNWDGGGYRRHWYVSDNLGQMKEMTGLDQGSHHEIYGMSVFNPSSHVEPQKRVESDHQYVAQAWSFDISGDGDQVARQFGTITPVWVVSNNGIDWSYPFGHTSALEYDPDEYAMVMPFTNPIRYGDDIVLHYSLANYEHSRWNSTPGRQLEVGFASMPVSEFEAMFAPSVEPEPEPEPEEPIKIDPKPEPVDPVEPEPEPDPMDPVDPEEPCDAPSSIIEAFDVDDDGTVLIDPDVVLAFFKPSGAERIAFTRDVLTSYS